MHAAMLMMQIHHEHIRLGLTANWKKCKYGKDEPDSLTPDATAMLNDIDASTVDPLSPSHGSCAILFLHAFSSP